MDQQLITKKRLKVTFAAGVSTVTGANFLIETMDEERVIKILIDCGLEQGSAEAARRNAAKFSYDVSSIDYLFVTHAHIDHIGRVPKLIKEGFKGKIFSTPETMALAPIMLEDSARLLLKESEHNGVLPIYNEEDVAKTMQIWEEIPYHVSKDLNFGISVVAKDAGHILGSAMFEFSYNKSKIVFTGDLGNSPSPILKDTEVIDDATYLVMESVYGDRNHESIEGRRAKLEDVIEDAYRNKGALIIPCFSLEKTQVILSEMNTLIEEERVRPVPVYLDSPLAIKVTEIYEKFSKDFNPLAEAKVRRGDDLFDFPGLRMISSVEDSKGLLEVPNPKIIIAGSGMSTGGRVLHHELNYLPDPKSTILLVGYQTMGTLGRHIQNKEKTVRIFGNTVPVKAKIEFIDGYSSHKDSDNLLKFIETSKGTLKKVFPVMGEPKSALFLVQKIKDNLGIDAYHPEEGESLILDF